MLSMHHARSDSFDQLAVIVTLLVHPHATCSVIQCFLALVLLLIYLYWVSDESQAAYGEKNEAGGHRGQGIDPPSLG